MTVSFVAQYRERPAEKEEIPSFGGPLPKLEWRESSDASRWSWGRLNSCMADRDGRRIHKLDVRQDSEFSYAYC